MCWEVCNKTRGAENQASPTVCCGLDAMWIWSHSVPRQLPRVSSSNPFYRGENWCLAKGSRRGSSDLVATPALIICSIYWLIHPSSLLFCQYGGRISFVYLSLVFCFLLSGLFRLSAFPPLARRHVRGYQVKLGVASVRLAGIRKWGSGGCFLEHGKKRGGQGQTLPNLQQSL
jgi:hypothetical protein